MPAFANYHCMPGLNPVIGHKTHVFDVVGSDTVEIQVHNESGTWGGTLTIEESIDGRNFVGLASAVTITANGITTITGHKGRYLRGVWTVAGTAAHEVTISVYATKD